ncbi:Putative citrate lyase beta chain [Oceaniovalibus guishaninsula JLT2003]|uniref:Putative citrate lyase beta chain n=1 Tax=Oceaniovalibus guishaninsula JLT2003 TaxID=1231392 RepID=K2GSR9_9RHOB|nr:CoA ester lyase [Oceaniovalibus guishaninsula]EKE45591.1 Putative citrate lyase beta chain [Oceaniovalibus guishaninsula JLT2003]
MNDDARAVRSVLYIPGDKPRAMDKARGLNADALIFDLEDAVAVDAKADGREGIVAALSQGGFRAMRLVRVNAADTEWADADLDAILSLPADALPDAILLPKVNGADDIAALARRLDGIDGAGSVAIWAMIETARGVLNAASIADAPGMGGFVVGTNDLAAELGCRPGQDRMALMTALQLCVLAARAGGIPCIDGVYNAFKDEDGLRTESAQGRDLGMDGKSLIHPAQVDPVNAVFSPSEDEIALARRHIAAWTEAERDRKGIAVVDGRIVENLHVAAARGVLARAGLSEGNAS